MDTPSNQLKRDIKSILITIVLYLTILFLWHNNSLSKPSINKVENKTLLSLSTFKPKPIYETSLFENDTLDDLDEIMSEPIIKEKILSTKPKPIVHKKILKRVKKRKKLVKTKIHKKYKKKNVSKITKISNKQFISKLKRKIERNKHYPRMAKKRRLEGRVSISFKVTKSGGVSNISVRGSKLFLKSAKDAIKKSFPINVKGVKVPISVRLTLNYKIL